MLRQDADGGGGSGGVGRAVGAAAAKAIKRVSSSVKKSPSRSRARVAQPVRRKSSSSSRRYSGSSGGGSSSRSVRRSSGSGGSSSRRVSAGKAPARSAPKVPSLAAYLGTDSVYQGAVRGGKRSLADFISEMNRRRGEAGTQFNQTKASMERDRTQQLEALRDEFASRGLIQSGLYGEEQGRFQEQFNTQMTSLGQQQAALLADLLSQQKNYQRENDLALEAAKQEALQRRAARYKIGA